jgi:hypothetical protein
MVMLVHLAPAKLERAIRRSGVQLRKEGLFGGYKSAFVYAFPVLENHTITHQWTREVMKWRRQPMIGVYFRVADDEEVAFGHFRSPLRRLPAAAAVGEIRKAKDQRGFEILLERKIPARDIIRIAPVRGVVGWRHSPEAHARKPCGCPACVLRGEPGGKKLRARYEAGDS